MQKTSAPAPVDASALLARYQQRAAVVAVIGLGYVGLPLVKAILGAGFKVVGLDVDREKVAALEQGRTYIRHVPAEPFSAAIANGRFRATTDFTALKDADAILICVPTPLTSHREPDLSYVEATTRAVAAQLKAGHLVILESTTYPGTTCGVMKPILEARGMRSGRDFFLAYSPEREDPGNPAFATTAIPKVIGGDGAEALALANALYSAFVPQTVPVSSPDTAEAVKLTENVFRAVNIALVNELKILYEAMGIDVWEVIDAAKTKPFGYMPFYPGPGLGGHCIPIDPFYLTWKAREYELPTRFIELAGETNTQMPRHVVGRLADELNHRTGRGLKGARVLIVGLAYKKNVDDTRESPSFKLMELLEGRGAACDVHDPLVPVVPRTREHASFAGRKSVALDAAAVASYDVVLIATDHDAIDYKALVGAAKLVIDTRNACARAGAVGGNVVKA
ncbi:MAG TPA: nucleotide sugar dehydrogenase [Hyphomicrobiaceae bacterium]|nr:nucleotide sugar dehydrogenase [Hyphomicrobiaceae bacterium]